MTWGGKTNDFDGITNEAMSTVASDLVGAEKLVVFAFAWGMTLVSVLVVEETVVVSVMLTGSSMVPGRLSSLAPLGL